MEFNQTKLLFWENHLKIWGQKNISQAEYCRQNNLNHQSFSKWKIRLSLNGENKFVKIPIKSLQIESEIEMFIKKQYRLVFKSDFKKEVLEKILEVIGE
jgi:hypothetical protein